MSQQFVFKKASKAQARLRMAMIGPPGSGKTYSGLRVATELARRITEETGKKARIAGIDSEKGSMAKYANLFDFEVLELESFSPTTYVDAITAAELADFAIIFVDSLSHAWVGKDGALEQVDKVAARGGKSDSFGAWRTVTPQHNALVTKLVACKAHLIATMRTKTEYVIEKNERTGKNAPRKIGLAPVQRDGLEYEFDVVGDMDENNIYSVTKTRCPELNQASITQPGEQLGTILYNWLTDGTPLVEKPEVIAPPSESRRIDQPEIKALFDELDAPEAKRLATAQKYLVDDKLIEILTKRVTEQRAELAARAEKEAKTAAAAADKPTEATPS